MSVCQSSCEAELLIFSSKTPKQFEDGFKYGGDNKDNEYDNITSISILQDASGCFRMLQDASGCFRMLDSNILTLPRGVMSEGRRSGRFRESCCASRE